MNHNRNFDRLNLITEKKLVSIIVIIKKIKKTERTLKSGSCTDSGIEVAAAVSACTSG